MSYIRMMALLMAIVGVASCKLGGRFSSAPKTNIADDQGNLLAFAAITTLSFRDKQSLPPWEAEARIRCGDRPYPQLSRLDDLVYELIPEAVRRGTSAINRGDASLCRYQPPTPDNMSMTRNLFADKALAVKVKYLEGHEHSPPPTIRFNSGGAVHIPQARFASLFIGSCSQFAMMNGIQFCKTTDRRDGRVIWVTLVAPQVSGVMPHGTGKLDDGKGVIVVEQQQAGGKIVEQVDTIKGVEQVEVGKGMVGKDGVSLLTPNGGRIDMDITLPWLQGGFNLSVDVPNFNSELIAHMQGGGGYVSPPVHPTTTTVPTAVDYGNKLDRDKIAILVPRPLVDPRGSSADARLLRLTLKTRPDKPHTGKWIGFGKTALGIAGGVATAAAIFGGIGLPLVAVVGVLSAGAGVTGVMDLGKWWSSVSDRGAYDDFKVPASSKDCPAIYGTNLTFDNDDLYLTFKAERRKWSVAAHWDNIGRIQHTPIGHIGTNAWSRMTLDGFTVYYCRKSYEKHCHRFPDKMFSEDLKGALSNCANTNDSIIAAFGQ